MTDSVSPAAEPEPTTPAEGLLPAGKMLMLAVCVGLAAGVAEFRWVLAGIDLGFQVRLSAHYVWMIPAADVLFAVAATIALLGAGRWWPRARSPAVVAGVLVSLAAAELLLVVGQIHWVAIALLAVGLGVQSARMAGGRIARLLYRVAPAVAVILAVIVVLLGVRMTLGLRAHERAALAALPAPRDDARNVLLLILDTVRFKGIVDSAENVMPQLARYAGQGIYFERAIAPSPWTLPSHASMFTGYSPDQLSADWNSPLDATHPTLAEALARRGYVTAGFVANLLFATRATGLGRGFITYDDYPVSLGQILLSSSLGRWLAGNSALRKLVGHHELLNRKSAAGVTDAFLDWERRNGGRPFFAFVNFFEAHEPYFPPGYAGSMLWPGRRWTDFLHIANLPNGESAWIRNKWDLSPAEIEIHVSGYHRAVRDVDVQLGRLLDELARRGVLQNTLIIIAGDHGEQLGEHGLFEHNNSFYLPALHVPLVILPAGDSVQRARVARVVSLRDIPATVLDLLGESAVEFPGRSLAPLWRSPLDSPAAEVAEDTVLSYLTRGLVRQEWYPVNRGTKMYSLTTQTHHYILNGDGTEELYDWRSDPSESVNLSGRSDADSLLTRFRRTLGGLRNGR